MSALTLYGWQPSTYTRSVLLALLEKRLDYDLVTVTPFAEEGLDETYKTLQPFGKIPALTDGGFHLYETAAILRYLDEGFQGPPLQPSDPQARARMQQIIALLDSYGYRALVWDIFVNLGEPPSDAETLARGQQVGRTVLAEIAGKMDTPWLLGEALTLADCHLAPILRYAMAVPEGEALIAEHPKVRDWWQRIQSRPGWDSVLTLPPDA